MSDNSFAEQIRKTAEALHELYQVAHDEEKRAAEERRKEKAKRKTECSAVCQRVLLPAMKLLAMGLEGAKVFAPQCWKVDYEPSEDNYHCICWARLPKKEMGVIIKSTMTMLTPEEESTKIQVQVKCCQAVPGNWEEGMVLPSSEPSEGVAELFVDNLHGLNTANLDDWHKKRLADCAKACAIWLEEHSCASVA